jgi:hypothetical protein
MSSKCVHSIAIVLVFLPVLFCESLYTKLEFFPTVTFASRAAALRPARELLALCAVETRDPSWDQPACRLEDFPPDMAPAAGPDVPSLRAAFVRRERAPEAACFE